MSKQIIIVLILALLASAGGWLLLNNQSLPKTEVGQLFGDIEDYVTNIDEITIENSEGLVVKAKRMASIGGGRSGQTFPIQASEVEPQRWFIMDVAGSQQEFAADQKKLSLLMGALVNAKLVEPKTSQVNKYERLGLRSIEDADSQAIKVSVSAKSNKWQVLVGNEASSGSGFYVRKPKEKQTWLSDQKFDIDEVQSAWLNQVLFDFSASNIRTIKRLDEEQWTIEKTDDSANEFHLVDRQDSPLKYDTVLEAYVDSLATLSFDELNEMDDAFWSTLRAVVELEFELFAGDKYQLSVAENDEKHYVKITSIVDEDFWLQWLFEVSPYTKAQLNKFHGDFLVEEVEEVSVPISN
jgi:hypothetical protein